MGAFKAARDDRAARRHFLGRHGLRPWLAAVQQRRQERWRARVVAVTHARRVAQGALVAWAEARADTVRERAAALHHARRLLGLRWVLAARPRRLAQATSAAQADNARARGRLARALGQWREHVTRRRRLQLCAQGQLRLAVHLRYWRRWVSRAREEAAWRERVIRWSIERPRLYETVVGLVPSGSKRLALQAWLGFCARQARARELAEGAALHHARSLAGAAIAGLRRHAQAARAARAEAQGQMVAAERLHLGTGLRRWRRAVAASRAEKQVEADRRRLRKLLRAWAEHTRHMKMARAWLHSSTKRRALWGGEQAPN